MKCRLCGSEKIYRSRRSGIKEGLFLRLAFRAPFRCHDCQARYSVFGISGRRRTSETRQTLADFLGFRGRDYRLRQMTVAAVLATILLVAAILFITRMVGQ